MTNEKARPTIYLCGPVTGREDETMDRFRRAQVQLEANGYRVENPTLRSVPGANWNAAMRVCLTAMLNCTGVALMEGWDDSRGATIERTLAEDLDMPVATVEEWTWGCHE